MTLSHKDAIARLRGARIDGRTENVRYRQSQLQYLHRELASIANDLRGAIRKDANFSESEANVEFAAGMTCVKRAYESLDFDQALEDEYNPTKGLDYPHRRAALGIVYVRPAKAFPFYNILAPVSAAIAAGDCVLLQLDGGLRYVPDLLRSAFWKALDSDAVCVIEGDVEDRSFLTEAVFVDQTSTAPRLPASSELRTCGDSRVITIVDRTANVDEAASVIIQARLAFNGRSNYAPDLVVVNEFVKKQFLEAAARHIVAQNGTPSNSQPQQQSRSIAKQAESDSAASIVASGSDQYLVDISSRFVSVSILTSNRV
jgi:acyl-CoA reductase-like NAD-dependent aldehyde dehydrogenase